MFDLEKAKAVCEKATHGEWWTGADQDAVWGPDGDQIAKVWGNLAYGQTEEDNAAFIAAARTLLPAAIEEIERLAVEVVTLKALVESAEAEDLIRFRDGGGLSDFRKQANEYLEGMARIGRVIDASQKLSKKYEGHQQVFGYLEHRTLDDALADLDNVGCQGEEE